VLPFGLGIGATGAWFSMAFTQAMQGVMAMWAFRQGAWKAKKV
jgi:Na+-driven multidrug efflux pump